MTRERLLLAILLLSALALGYLLGVLASFWSLARLDRPAPEPVRTITQYA